MMKQIWNMSPMTVILEYFSSFFAFFFFGRLFSVHRAFIAEKLAT